MTEGQVNEQIPDDLELVEADAATEARASADRATQDAAQCTFDGLLCLIGSSPRSAPLVLDMLARAHDWPMADEIAQHIRALLQPEIPAETGEQSEHLAGRDEAPAPVDPIRETAIAADAAATQAAREAGRQVMAQAYESNRILAVAAVETMIAHAQVALAALKWEPENVPVIAGYLIQADRQLRIASHAVDARLHLADTEECVMATRGETVPSAA